MAATDSEDLVEYAHAAMRTHVRASITPVTHVERFANAVACTGDLASGEACARIDAAVHTLLTTAPGKLLYWTVTANPADDGCIVQICADTAVPT